MLKLPESVSESESESTKIPNLESESTPLR